MSSLLLITHGDLGACLIAQARHVIGTLGLTIRVLGVEPDADPAMVEQQARSLCEDLGPDSVILTDVYGATPSNIAHRVADGRPVVHGLNLAMLLRGHNYADLSPDELASHMVSGGQRSIFSGDQPPDPF
ncbi:MAG: hypothetical protein AAGB27_13860 [Pseudomonadota bacterium]